MFERPSKSRPKKGGNMEEENKGNTRAKTLKEEYKRKNER